MNDVFFVIYTNNNEHIVTINSYENDFLHTNFSWYCLPDTDVVIRGEGYKNFQEYTRHYIKDKFVLLNSQLSYKKE